MHHILMIVSFVIFHGFFYDKNINISFRIYIQYINWRLVLGLHFWSPNIKRYLFCSSSELYRNNFLWIDSQYILWSSWCTNGLFNICSDSGRIFFVYKYFCERNKGFEQSWVKKTLWVRLPSEGGWNRA